MEESKEERNEDEEFIPQPYDYWEKVAFENGSKEDIQEDDEVEKHNKEEKEEVLDKDNEQEEAMDTKVMKM